MVCPIWGRNGQITRCITSTITSCGVRSQAKRSFAYLAGSSIPLSTATRYWSQSRIRWTSVSRRYAMSTIMTCNRCISLLTTYTCSCPRIRNTRRARLYGRLRASQRERCGSNTNRFWNSICGEVDSGSSHTMSGRQAQCRARRLNSILSELNTFSGAYGLHPRGLTPRHSACLSCRRLSFHISTGAC